MSLTTQFAHLDSQLRELFASAVGAANPRRDDEAFTELALESFSIQFEVNLPYRWLCEARGITPGTVKNWKELPVVSTSAFKEAEFSCLAPAERTTVFHSSGTTTQVPSRHFHNEYSLRLYEASALAWFANVLSLKEAASIRFLFLTPAPDRVPHSSLVHMFAAFRKRWGTTESRFAGNVAADGLWHLDFEKTLNWLQKAIAAGEPVWVFGTAFSFVQLIDHCAAHNISLALPPGSKVLETGGYKGQSRVVPREELHTMIRERFDIEPHQIVCEYGMCELSSQACATLQSGPGLEQPTRLFRFAPWVRTLTFSPETGQEVAEGETGLLRVIDLANLYSVVAIQTEDLAIRQAGGFELIGRTSKAEQRGCSLMAGLAS